MFALVLVFIHVAVIIRKDEAEEGDSTGAKSRGGVDAHGGHVELSDDEEDDVIDGDEELAFAEDQLTRALHGTLPLSLKGLLRTHARTPHQRHTHTHTHTHTHIKFSKEA